MRFRIAPQVEPFLIAMLTVALLVIGSHSANAGTFLEGVQVAAGANGTWLDGPSAAWPADFEAGGSASGSLSPHVSTYGDLYYGFSHSYVRWDAGAKLTVSDAENPNFNVFLCVEYRGGSIAALQPNEAAYGAGFGWKPSPQRFPNLIVGAKAAIGGKSDRTVASLAFRYLLPVKLK